MYNTYHYANELKKDSLLEEGKVKKYMVKLLEMNPDSYKGWGWREIDKNVIKKGEHWDIENVVLETHKTVKNFLDNWEHFLKVVPHYNEVIDFYFIIENIKPDQHKHKKYILSLFVWILQPRKYHRNVLTKIIDIKYPEVEDTLKLLQIIKKQKENKYKNIRDKI